MYTYIIIDPRSLNIFKNKSGQAVLIYQQGAENCFKTISKRNAMMVLDSDGMMREEYKNT